MAHFMEYFLNLLFLRGKIITATAAETLHEAIKKCLQYKREISTDYKNATQMVPPFENMMDAINYNAKKYTSEGENSVVTSDLRHLLSKEQNHEEGAYFKNVQEATTPKTAGRTHLEDLNADWLHRDQPQIDGLHDNRNNENIVDNIHAILRSQEFLLKNVIKLINLLEKDRGRNRNLEEIKKKLKACTDILSNRAQQKFSNLINSLIQEEIPRCRFRHGERKTSAEIDLKSRRLEGIEAALDTSHKKHDGRETKKHFVKKSKQKDENLINSQIIKTETKRRSLKQANSELDFRSKNLETILKQTKSVIEEAEKLIQENQNHFNNFEKNLWHKLTSLKFMSLKNDQMNMSKCAIYNKKQFVVTEETILKKINIEQEDFKKIGEVSNSAFRILERHLLADKDPQLFERQNQEKKVVKEVFPAEEKRRLEIEVIKKSFPKEEIKTVKKNNQQEIKSVKNVFPAERDRQEKKLVKKIFPWKDNKLQMKTVNAPPVFIGNEKKKILEDQGNNKAINANDVNRITESHTENGPLAFVIENKTQTVLKSRQILPTLQNNKEINTVIKAQTINSEKNLVKGTPETKLKLQNSQENKLTLEVFGNVVKVVKHVDKQKNFDKMPENRIEQATNKYFIETLRKSDLTEKPTILKNKKIKTIKPETPRVIEKKLSSNDAQLIYTNKKAFDELKTTLRTVHLVDRNPPQATLEKDPNSKRKPDVSSRGSGDERRDFHTDVKKSNTFLKNSKSLEKSEKPSLIKVPRSAPNMRRTTKNAIKREQMVTILPKIVKNAAEKKKPRVCLVEIDKIACAKTKYEKEVGVDKKKSFVKFSDKVLNKSFVTKFVQKSSKNVHCGDWKEGETNVEPIFED